MKLATIRSDQSRGRNGCLIVVSRDLKTAVQVEQSVSQDLLEAVRNWSTVRPQLQELYDALNGGSCANSFAYQAEHCLAPLPNAPGFYDGSAFLSHVHRARKSRGDTMPESAKKTPLMYQGVSDNLLAHNTPLEIMDEAYGGDFEGEFAVIVDDVPRGTAARDMDKHLILFSMFNDITYREVLKTEIQTKFGFLQSKPNSSFAPIVVTPDEFGSVWENGRIVLDMEVHLNGELFGNPNGREMHFSFQELVAHAGRTRPLAAGSIIGTGTVSNEDKARGFACLTEKRYQEIMDGGKAETRWLKPGDELTIDVKMNNLSLFGSIQQKVTL